MCLANHTSIASTDVARMLELNGELHELPPLLIPRAQHLVAGVCKLIGAQVALFSDLRDYRRGWEWKINPLLDTGWAGPAERSAFMAFFEGEQMDDPLTPCCVRAQGNLVTVLRRQLVDDRTWYRSANVNELRRAGRLDDCIYSHYHLNETGRAMGLAFHRPWGDRPFGERERAIVDLMHRSQPLYSRAFSPDRDNRDLPPRRQEVLAALKDGCSEKETAARLGLSPHTVHVHVKAIYRHFAVRSRGELMSLWVKHSSTAGARL